MIECDGVVRLHARATDGVADELADILDILDDSWTNTSTTDAPSLDDLDPQELRRIERSWEI